MKQILPFLFIIFLFSSCYKFTSFGTYEYGNSKSNYGKLTLNKDKSFHFYNLSCIAYCSSINGFGTYEISKDSLILYPQGTPDSIVTKIRKESIDFFEKTKNQDELYISIYLEIYDKNDKSPLAFAGVTTNTKQITNSGQTDENGKLKLDILKTNLPLDLKISYLGYQPVHLEINDPQSNYNIRIKMKPIDNILNNSSWLHRKDVRKIEFSGDTLWMYGRHHNSPWIKN